MAESELDIRCSCGYGNHWLSLWFDRDEYSPEVYVSFGTANLIPFTTRIKEAWNILRGKRSSYAEVILDEKSARKVAHFFIGYVNDVNTP